MKRRIHNAAKRIMQLGVILVCATCLTSCSAVTGLVSFLITLPFRLISAVCP